MSPKGLPPLTLSGRGLGGRLNSITPDRIDHTRNGLTRFQRADLARDLGDALVAQGACRGVGGDGDLGVLPERVVSGQWFGAEHVQRGAGHLVALQQGQQIGFNQVRAARHVDQVATPASPLCVTTPSMALGVRLQPCTGKSNTRSARATRSPSTPRPITPMEKSWRSRGLRYDHLPAFTSAS